MARDFFSLDLIKLICLAYFSGKLVVHIVNVTVSIMLQFMSIRFYNFYYRVHMQNKKEKDNRYVCLMIFENKKTTIFYSKKLPYFHIYAGWSVHLCVTIITRRSLQTIQMG